MWRGSKRGGETGGRGEINASGGRGGEGGAGGAEGGG